MRASFAHSCRSPPGSRRSSLWAGTTISSSGGRLALSSPCGEGGMVGSGYRSP
ncbi:unnamed protein product [[Actinomadura] parvosata subsp. kistnae]|nr:unnamed protein product [Actinomadura parvosata subsp. kistnae]